MRDGSAGGLGKVIEYFQSSDGSSYGVPVLILVALTVVLIGFFIFAALVKRFRGKRSSGLEATMSFGDLDKMGRKGLLTDEEVRMVRQAMSRRYLEQQNTPRAAIADLESEAARALAASAGKRRAGGDGGDRLAEAGEPTDPRIDVETLMDQAPDPPEPTAPEKGPSLADLARQGKVSQKEFEALKAVFEKGEDPENRSRAGTDETDPLGGLKSDAETDERSL